MTRKRPITKENRKGMIYVSCKLGHKEPALGALLGKISRPHPIRSSHNNKEVIGPQNMGLELRQVLARAITLLQILTFLRQQIR